MKKNWENEIVVRKTYSGAKILRKEKEKEKEKEKKVIEWRNAKQDNISNDIKIEIDLVR